MDLMKRKSLLEKIQLMQSLGLWDPNIPDPDPHALERAQRLNDNIEAEIYKLYLPEQTRGSKVAEIKRKYLQKSKQKREKKLASKKKGKVDRSKKLIFSHLGRGVSSWLNNQKENTELLKKNNLPSIPNASSLSELLGKSIPQIKHLSYHRKIYEFPPYTEFSIPKQSGGHRHISRPTKFVDEVQRILKEEVFDNISFPDHIHGFTKKRNIYNNAREHKGAAFIVNIDIKNYFGSIRYHQVRSAIKNLGYSGEISSVLSLLVTKQEISKLSINDKTVYRGSDFRLLPQGSCTSPIISNLVGLKFDKQLIARAKNFGYKYTRYADDLTFSTKQSTDNLTKLLYMARRTLELHGFKANERKTKVHFGHNQQEVTGLVINNGNPRPPRKWRRRLRARVHNFQFIDDPSEQEAEYYRLLGCLQYLKLSHPHLVLEYRSLLIRTFRPQ